jgi:excisionase family DNA binding protein
MQFSNLSKTFLESGGTTTVIEKLWKPDELANVLRITKGTVLQLFRSGRLPGIKVGGSVRFSPSDIRVWIMDQGRKTLPKIEGDAG